MAIRSFGASIRQGKGRLPRGFIPAGQEHACKRWLKVRGQRPALSGWAIVIHGKEAERAFEDRTVIFDRELMSSGRDRILKAQRGAPKLCVQCNCLRRNTIHGRSVECEIFGV
jgi:hypothetical protein